ncbi:MAG TPA: DUF2203 domain-containing protein [Bryobacteraceae bacterium]|nr:DUF2203 domain-containing protein [Bryobacteraceae bacterium]
MPRYFTLLQAERLLPEVEAAIRDAIKIKTEYAQIEAEYHAELQRVMMLGGADLSRTSVLEKRDRRDLRAHRLKEIIQQLHENGCIVKDLDIGLVDFPTLFRNQEVYLCWRLGETGISFWHGVEEGFQGRKPIGKEFLDNHKGDPQN